MNNDPVNNPSHYIRDGIECIDAIRAALGPLGFRYYCQGNSIKYSFRAGHKGDASQDFAKSETFARWASEVVVKPDPRLNADCTYSMDGGHTLYGDAEAIGALNNYITESIKMTMEMIFLREVLEGVKRDRIKLTDDIEILRKAREDEREALEFSDLRYSALLDTTVELSKRLDQLRKVTHGIK